MSDRDQEAWLYELFRGFLEYLYWELLREFKEETGMSNALQVDFLAAGVVDASGVALAGGKVYTYAAGTTTDKATYTDAAMTTPAANPVILNDAGVANIYAYGNYKFSIYDADDALVRTLDNCYYIVADYTPATVTTVTSTTTCTAVNQVYVCNTASGNITMNLPTAVGNEGVTLTFIKSSASNTLTLDGYGSETINGSTTVDMTANNALRQIISDNANWIIINSNATSTVTEDGTQTLTNKTVYDSTFYVKDNDDNTKIMQFDCGTTIGTGTTTTLIVPATAGSGTIVTDVSTVTMTNKTLTTPVIASAYQDAGKTQLMTLPNTASDTLCAIAATQTLTNKTLTSPVLNTGLSGTAFLDEDNMASNSATKVASQQSIKAYVDSGTVTMTNKTLTTPTITSPLLGNGTIVRAYRGSSNQSISSGAATQVQFNAETYDPGNLFASYIYTAPTNGYYQVHSKIYFTASDIDQLYLYIYIGATPYSVNRWTPEEALVTYLSWSIFDVIPASATNQISIYINATFTGTGEINYGNDLSYVSIRRIST